MKTQKVALSSREQFSKWISHFIRLFSSPASPQNVIYTWQPKSAYNTIIIILYGVFNNFFINRNVTFKLIIYDQKLVLVWIRLVNEWDMESPRFKDLKLYAYFWWCFEAILHRYLSLAGNIIVRDAHEFNSIFSCYDDWS